jgi:hypothetical protein
MTHDAALAADRQWGVQTADEIRAALRYISEGRGEIDGPLDPVNDTDAYIRALRQQADAAVNGSAEIVMNELADRMESEYMRDWEPEPPAQAPAQPFDWVGALDSLANEVSQNTNPGVGNRVDTIAHRVAERINPRLDPAGYAAALRAVDFTNEHVAVGPALRQLALAIEAEPAPAANVEQIRNRLSDQSLQLYSEMDRDGVAGLVPVVSGVLTPLLNSYIDNDRFLAAPAERLRSMLIELGHQIDMLETQGEYERAAASRLTDFHNDIEYALRDLQQPAPAAPALQAQQPTVYRPATQDQASVALMQINREIGNQARVLSDEHNEATTQLFATSIGRLYTENNLNEIGDTPASLNRFGNYLQGFRDDLAAQIPYLQRDGFTGVAAASAIQNVINEIDVRLVDFRLRGADLDNQRNDAMIQLENSLNDPELNPDDLRFLANGLSNPVDQTANSPWISLTERERREYALALRERANYIEFSPADFAIRLSNEDFMDIPDLRDTVQALNDGTFDHEILRGLPEVERGRAAQRTALNLNHILQGMQADANRAPVVTRQQQNIIDRVPQITDMLVDFSVDDPIETAADYRRVANILRDPRNAREFLENVMDVGSSLGDFVLRASDVRSSTLRLVADELESRAENWVAPADDANVARAADMRDTAEEIANLLEEGYYTETPNARAAVRLIRQHLRALRRNGEMAFEDILGMATTGYEWSPELLTALEVELESLIERYQGMDDYANGGPVRGYKEGGSVTDPTDEKAAFGIYPNAGKRSQKSDIGDKLNASVIPQDALDLAMTIMPFGKVGKALATAVLTGAPTEAQAGNMSTLLKLVAKEAPEQFHSIREALVKAFKTDLEHSVVGSTHMGGPSQVVSGKNSSVSPSKADIAKAQQNMGQSGLIDFHTHPNHNFTSFKSDFRIRPSDADLQYWMSNYGNARTATTPNEIKTMIGSPPQRQDGTTSAYNFFATNKPNQTLDRRAYDAARYELQRSKSLQSLKDNPVVGQYLDTGGTLGDLFESASPMLLQKLYAQRGLGRHDMRLSNMPTAGPLGTESSLFHEIANPAMEVLESKKFGSFANGGIVQQNPTTDQMRYALMMRRK